MLKVQEFLRNGGTLEDLAREPYNLFVRKHDTDGRVLLKYSPASPKNEIICQECRGLILDEESDWEIVCRSFNRFFNAGEEEAATLSVIYVFMKRQTVLFAVSIIFTVNGIVLL